MRNWGLKRWAILALAVLALTLAGLAFGAGVSAWLAWINEPVVQSRSAFSLAFPAPAQVPSVGAQAGESTPTPIGAPPTVAAATRPGPPTPAALAATATVPPARTATTTALALAGRRRIINTDGQGVALRASPGGARLRGKGYDEGIIVNVLERSGAWSHIRGDDGRDGWIPTVTLAP